MTTKEKAADREHSFTPAEQRAARDERIKVSEEQPYGWLAESESGNERGYHLFCNPNSRRLVCTCGDFIFRGKDDPAYKCKHISAVLKFIGRHYLATEYRPPEERDKVA